jgi:hypothetical protein
MATPPAALVDPSNPFIGPDYPAQLTCGQVMTPNGPRLCLTIRCGPATLTVTMERDVSKQWAAMIDREASKMSNLIVPNGVVIKDPKNG